MRCSVDGDFNLAVWQISSIGKLKSPPVLFLEGTVKASLAKLPNLVSTECTTPMHMLLDL